MKFWKRSPESGEKAAPMRWKRAVRYVLCLGLSVCAASLLLVQSSAANVQDISAAVSNGTVCIFRWHIWWHADKPPAGERYILMLDRDNHIVTGPMEYPKSDNAALAVKSNTTPYTFHQHPNKIDGVVYGDSDYTFYTAGSQGALYGYSTGGDSDNDGSKWRLWLAEASYPYEPYFQIGLNGSGDWDEFDEKDNGNRFGSNLPDWYGTYGNQFIDKFMAMGDSDKKIIPQYSNDQPFTFANYDKKQSDNMGWFYIQRNVSNKTDPAWQRYSTGEVWCDQENDNSKRDWFNVWMAAPSDITKYSILSRNYTISAGQTLTFNAKEGYNGLYIPPDVTLKIEAGGCLAINETVYNDGTILCEGGTVIIQEKGCLCPFSESKATNSTNAEKYDGKNRLIFRPPQTTEDSVSDAAYKEGIKVTENGGDFIIMQGGRLFTTEEYPPVLYKARLVNFGTYIMGGDLYLYSSFLENRSTGVIVAGYNVKNGYQRPNLRDVTVNSYSDTSFSFNGFGLTNTKQAAKDYNTAVDNSTLTDSQKRAAMRPVYGTIHVFDTEEHYATYGCMNQDGRMYNFTFPVKLEDWKNEVSDVKCTNFANDDALCQNMKSAIMNTMKTHRTKSYETVPVEGS